MGVAMSRKHGSSARTLAVWTVILLIVLGVGTLAVGGCGGSNKQTSDVIKIGFLGDLSGANAPDGISLLGTTKQFVAETNGAGGLLGKQLELVVEDGASDPKTSNEKAKALLGKDVDVVVGPILSAVRNAVYPTICDSGTILLYAIIYEGGAYDDLMFMLGEVPQQTISAFVPWLVENDGKKFFLVGNDYEWPRGSNAWVKEYLKPLGGTIVGEEYVPFNTTDFSSILTRIAKAKPDVFLSTLVGTDAIAFTKQFYNYGLMDTIHFASLFHPETYIQGIGKQPSEGIQCSLGYFNTLQTPENAAFLEGYRKFESNVPATTETAGTYTLLKMWGAAVKKAGTTDSQKVRQQLEGLSMASTPIGPVQMRDFDHHTARHIYVGVVHDGAYEVVKDFGIVEPGEDQRTLAAPE